MATRTYGRASQLASTGADYLLVSRNGIDGLTFDGLDVAHGTDKLSLYDHSWGATLTVNQFNIAVGENDDRVTAVRDYGVTGAVTIPTDGFVVAANGASLPYLNSYEAEDVMLIRPTDVCSPRTYAVPVIMFHDLGLSDDAFEDTLFDIDAEGYTTVSLSDLEAFLYECEPLPSNPIMLTFDDAYVSQFAYAPALLDAYGMVGTFFVITSYPSSLGWVATWTAIDAAHDTYPDSVELACHSHNAHVMIGNVGKYLTMSDLERETDLEDCRDTLYAHTGVETTAVAWPFGAYDEELVETAEDLGYSLLFTTWPGLNHPDNSDAGGHVRRFGANVANAWSVTETVMNRWHVCENL